MILDAIRTKIEKLVPDQDIIQAIVTTSAEGKISLSVAGTHQDFPDKKTVEKYLKKLEKKYQDCHFILTSYQVRPKVP